MPRLAPAQRRAQLLDVGRLLFADGAYDDVSTDVIRQATGCSIGMIYHHFGSKRGYYHATVASVASALIEVTEPTSDELGPALIGSLDAFVAFVAEHPRIYRAMLRGGVGSDDEASAIVEQVRQTSVDRVVERLGGGVDRVTRMKVYGWVAFVEAVTLDWLEHRELSPTELRDLLIQTLGSML